MPLYGGSVLAVGSRVDTDLDISRARVPLRNIRVGGFPWARSRRRRKLHAGHGADNTYKSLLHYEVGCHATLQTRLQLVRDNTRAVILEVRESFVKGKMLAWDWQGGRLSQYDIATYQGEWYGPLKEPR